MEVHNVFALDILQKEAIIGILIQLIKIKLSDRDLSLFDDMNNHLVIIFATNLEDQRKLCASQAFAHILNDVAILLEGQEY